MNKRIIDRLGDIINHEYPRHIQPLAELLNVTVEKIIIEEHSAIGEECVYVLHDQELIWQGYMSEYLELLKGKVTPDKI